MIRKESKNVMRVKRHKKIRQTLSGTNTTPRLCVFRSNAAIYAQLIDDVKDLNSLIVNFDRKKLEDLLLKLQTKYLDKSLVFELSYLTNPNGSFSSIDNVSDDDLKNKIPYYKSLCIDDLIKKCGREKYNEIVEKYELEV